MKKIFFWVLVSIFFYSACFAKGYTEDNGAYWYMKALEILPQRPYSSLFAPNTYSQDNFKKAYNFNLDILNKYVDYINKARSQEKCFFYVMPKYYDDENMVVPEKDRLFIPNKLGVASDLASYAVSINKPEYASLIWLSNLEISLNIVKDNSISVRITTGIPLKDTLNDLSWYFDNGASEEFKKPFIDFMKAWPSSAYDLNEIKKVHYDYYMQNLEKFSTDIEFLAKQFGYDKNAKKTKIVKNKICVKRISDMEREMQIFVVILHLYLYGLQKYDNDSLVRFIGYETFNYFNLNKDKISKILDEMYYHQLIKYMFGVVFIFFDNEYLCPENGYRTLDVQTFKRHYTGPHNINYDYTTCNYKISCSCKGKEELISPDPNLVAIDSAKKYRESSYYAKDMANFKKYCEQLLNTDFSKEHSKKDLAVIDPSAYHGNVLMRKVVPQNYGLGTKIESIKNTQKIINNFIKKYVSNSN